MGACPARAASAAAASATRAAFPRRRAEVVALALEFACADPSDLRVDRRIAMHAAAALAAGVVEGHVEQDDAAARRAIGDWKGGGVERQILHA